MRWEIGGAVRCRFFGDADSPPFKVASRPWATKKQGPTRGSRFVEGYATLYGEFHMSNAKSSHEVFLPHCFGDSLKGRVGFWVNHIETTEFASTDDGRLELHSDHIGLGFRWWPDMQSGHDVEILKSIEARDMHRMSLSYIVQSEGEITYKGMRTRTLRVCQLREISLVGSPAVSGTFAAVADAAGSPSLADAAKSGRLLNRRPV